MLFKIVNGKIPVVRAMPNTAIAIQESMTCISHTDVEKDDLEYIMELFTQLGKVPPLKKN